MNAAQIAQLAIILAPLAKDIAVEGTKVVASFRENISQEQIDKSLELSKSTSWPELDFGQTEGQ